MTPNATLKLMANQRTEAEVLAVCLELELATVGDAFAWADGQILASEVPHNVLCDISMASRANRGNLAIMLRRLPGDYDNAWVVRRLIQCAAECLRRGEPEARKVAIALFNLALDEKLPPGKLRDEVYWFYDAIDLATSGIVQETPQQLVSRMLESLDGEIADTHDGE